MADPSFNVHQDLLPHVHLISHYRYPVMVKLETSEVTKWLMAAPKIARDRAPFFWTYLNGPADGSIFLTWQPSARRGLEFSSDGYIWGGPEMFYRQEVGNGLILEAYILRYGYLPGEQFAVHSRKRFRFCPPQVQMPNVPQVDPNLWIVHYGPAEKNERVPASMIPVTPQIQSIMSSRQQLFQMGQIVNKEFMLSDRASWPQLPFPARGQSIFAAPPNTRGVPQGMAYPPHGGPTGGSKRRGGQGALHQPPVPASGPLPESVYDDDEDTSRGDMFDHLTAREISMARYQQNHEWMEEILSSPYRLSQIVVPDLGLGRKGELASLTDGIFEAPGADALVKIPEKPYTGRLDPVLADEFRKRIEDKTNATKAEVDQLKARHEEMMARFRGNAAINHAEQALRFSVEETGPEFWRLEGGLDDSEENLARRHSEKVDDIVARVEALVGRQASVSHDLFQVQAGGYLDPVVEPAPAPQPPQAQQTESSGSSAQMSSMSRQPSNAGSQAEDTDMEMGGTAAGLLDQMHTGFSSSSPPTNNFPTPQAQPSAVPSSVATPMNINVSPPQPTPTPAPQAQAQQGSAPDDVNMEDAEASKGNAAPLEQGAEGGDWVVVPKGGVSPDPPAGNAAEVAANSSAAAQPSSTAASTTAPTTTTAAAPATAPVSSSKSASGAPTPGDDLTFNGDSNDFSSLGDLDTAGDALAGYDPPSINSGGAGGDDVDDLADDLNMDMEDSAFGDAFHGVEASTPAPDAL